MKLYFLHDGQSEFGPFTIQELQTKSLKPETPVWYDGLPEWKTINTIEELKDFFKPNTPPPFKVSDSATDSAQDTSVYTPALDEYFPGNDKKRTVFRWVLILIVLASAIIFYLFYQNKQHDTTISRLQDQVIAQQDAVIQKETLERRQAEATRLANEAIENDKKTARSNWEKLITLSHADPDIDYTLGGIGSFYVYITNQASYMIDQVDVQVNYIRKNGKVWQSKIVRLFNISPNIESSAVAPASFNGVRVEVSIVKVVSKQMGFCYPNGAGKMGDPYFCR